MWRLGALVSSPGRPEQGTTLARSLDSRGHVTQTLSKEALLPSDSEGCAPDSLPTSPHSLPLPCS